MTSKERVKALRQAGFAGYDQPLDSKCDHPERYAVTRTREAEAVLAQSRVTAPRSAPRAKPYKHTFALTEAREGRMHKARIALADGEAPATVQFVTDEALDLLFEHWGIE